MKDETIPSEVDHQDDIPTDHPRYNDLVTRHRIEQGVRAGITHLQGMHAEGRGSAFDYLLGERTIDTANGAERAAAAHLLLADHPVISVNGNVAALVPSETVELAAVVDADIEINLFNRSEERLRAIATQLRDHGATNVKGLVADGRLPGLNHDRAKVAVDGIYTADVVLVPLEDGDRAKALSLMGKTEIVIDLNPLSRSPQVADVPIIDNVIRAIPNITDHAKSLSTASPETLATIVKTFDRIETLEDAERTIREGFSPASGSES